MPYCPIDTVEVAKYSLHKGDIVFARTGGTVGKSYIINAVPEPSVFASYLIRLSAHKGINPRYLYYFFQSASYWEQIGIKKGGLQGNINATALSSLELPLCPTNEQRRIVAKIEELFSELDKAVESLTTALSLIQTMSKCLLNNAFTHLDLTRTLPDILAVPMSNGYSGKPVPQNTAFKVLSLSATTSGLFNPKHFKYLNEQNLLTRDIWCEPGDILIQRGNTAEYVGVPAIFTGKSKEFIFPDLMIRLRPDERQVSSGFLYYALLSPKIRNFLRRKAKGSAGSMPKINQAILSEVEIPYCDLESQREVVTRLESQTSNLNNTTEMLEEQISRCQMLKQSVLSYAFSGQLVPQDPNDEPASILLNRIRAEKETITRSEPKKRAKGASV